MPSCWETPPSQSASRSAGGQSEALQRLNSDPGREEEALPGALDAAASSPPPPPTIITNERSRAVKLAAIRFISSSVDSPDEKEGPSLPVAAQEREKDADRGMPAGKCRM